MNNNLSYIRQEGYKALISKLGITGTVVFIRQFENGQGNYTKEREYLLKDLTIDDIVSNIQKRKMTQIDNV